jgi:osmotically-inducible protein OsmY
MKALQAWSAVVALAAVALVSYGCENTGRARDQARETGREAKRETGEAAHGAGATLDAAKQTADVKTALMADKSVDASHINVDTDADTRTVILRGTVPSAAQKQAAERIAREKAQGYSVRNELTISAS